MQKRQNDLVIANDESFIVPKCEVPFDLPKQIPSSESSSRRNSLSLLERCRRLPSHCSTTASGGQSSTDINEGIRDDNSSSKSDIEQAEGTNLNRSRLPSSMGHNRLSQLRLYQGDFPNRYHETPSPSLTRDRSAPDLLGLLGHRRTSHALCPQDEEYTDVPNDEEELPPLNDVDIVRPNSIVLGQDQVCPNTPDFVNSERRSTPCVPTVIPDVPSSLVRPSLSLDQFISVPISHSGTPDAVVRPSFCPNYDLTPDFHDKITRSVSQSVQEKGSDTPVEDTGLYVPNVPIITPELPAMNSDLASRVSDPVSSRIPPNSIECSSTEPSRMRLIMKLGLGRTDRS